MRRIGKAALCALAMAFAFALMPAAAYASWTPDRVERLYNPNTGEHLYTMDSNEVKVLTTKYGWRWEKDQLMTECKYIASLGGYEHVEPVWRLYNPSTGEHIYTADAYEAQVLSTQRGWVHDFNGNQVWWARKPLPSEKNPEYPVYRLYNPQGGTYGHLFTTDENEREVLLATGDWQDEGVAWYQFRTTYHNR